MIIWKCNFKMIYFQESYIWYLSLFFFYRDVVRRHYSWALAPALVPMVFPRPVDISHTRPTGRDRVVTLPGPTPWTMRPSPWITRQPQPSALPGPESRTSMAAATTRPHLEPWWEHKIPTGVLLATNFWLPCDPRLLPMVRISLYLHYFYLVSLYSIALVSICCWKRAGISYT